MKWFIVSRTIFLFRHHARNEHQRTSFWLLEAFNNKALSDVLAPPKVLNEGRNIPDASVAIILPAQFRVNIFNWAESW